MKTTQLSTKAILFALSLAFSFCLHAEKTNLDAVFSIICPPDVTVNCNDELWDLSIYGNATYHDYSGYHDAGEPVVTYNLNSCNSGTIIRTWSVQDYTGYTHSCSQVISAYGNTINANDIIWPENIDLEGCNPNTHPDALPPGYDRPSYNYTPCSIIGTNWKDKVFEFGPGCYKIVREWTVIDCCIFNPNNGNGSWNHFQVINVTTGDTPILTCPDDIEVSTTNCEFGQVDLPDLEVSQNCALGVMVTNDSPYAYENGANASGDYPIGTTEVTFMVKYGCWQKTFCTMFITVIDDKAPQPYCIDGLAIPLMGIDTDNDGLVDDGMVEIWASDFDHGSYHPCNPDEELIFSFSSDPNDQSRTFSCAEVGENEIQVWVTDENGNQNYCTTHIDIQNNGANIPDCEPITTGSISGFISSVYQNSGSGLRLNVEAASSGMQIESYYDTTIVWVLIDSVISGSGTVIYHYDEQEIITETSDTFYTNNDFFMKTNEGDYLLEDIPFSDSYKLELELTDNLFQYIDQNDVALLNMYLNGDTLLNTYQILAADINHDKSINFDDLALLEGFVNGSLSGNEIDLSWHSLNANIELSNTESILNQNCPSYHFIEDHHNNVEGKDLIIFQMGDLTHDQIIGNDDDYQVSTISATHERITKARSVESQEIISLGAAPNPFKNECNIFLDNPASQYVQLRVFDAQGKQLIHRSMFLEKGNQSIQIGNKEYVQSGILFYTIETAQHKLNGKLVKL
jgi:hypothetical protein